MFNIPANIKILKKKPPLNFFFFKLKNKFDNIKRPQIDQQVKKCKKKKKSEEKKQSQRRFINGHYHWSDQMTKNFFSYDFTFGQ